MYEKMMGNVSKNDGQCFLKGWAMFFERMGNVFRNDGQRFSEIAATSQKDKVAFGLFHIFGYF